MKQDLKEEINKSRGEDKVAAERTCHLRFLAKGEQEERRVGSDRLRCSASSLNLCAISHNGGPNRLARG